MENSRGDAAFFYGVEHAIVQGTLLAYVKANPIIAKRFYLLAMAIRFDDASNNDFIVWSFLQGHDMNTTDGTWTLAHNAAYFYRKRKLELLCACGANLSLVDEYGTTPMVIAFRWEQFDCVKILIANGARISKTNPPCQNLSKLSEMILFQQGVLQCRDVIVTLLGLKKRRAILFKLDRFLVQQELAVAIWTTRSCNNDIWQE